MLSDPFKPKGWYMEHCSNRVAIAQSSEHIQNSKIRGETVVALAVVRIALENWLGYTVGYLLTCMLRNGYGRLGSEFQSGFLSRPE